MPEETNTATKPVKTSKPKAKKPAAKKTAKQIADAKLLAGAKKIRLAEAAKNKSTSKSPAKKNGVSPTTREAKVDEILPKIVEAKGPIMDILEKCVTIDKNGTGVGVKVAPETSIGEALRIFDYFGTEEGLSGIRFGNAVNAIGALPCMTVGGKSKYAEIMASTGRSLDRVKTLASVARLVPLPLQNLSSEIKIEHLRAASKLHDKPEEQKKLLLEAKEKADAGKPMTVKEIKAKADKLAPRKSQPKKTPAKAAARPVATRDMTTEEKDALIDLEDKAASLCAAIGGASFALEIGGEHTITLREKLADIARFSAKLGG